MLAARRRRKSTFKVAQPPEPAGFFQNASNIVFKAPVYFSDNTQQHITNASHHSLDFEFDDTPAGGASFRKFTKVFALILELYTSILLRIPGLYLARLEELTNDARLAHAELFQKASEE